MNRLLVYNPKTRKYERAFCFGVQPYNDAPIKAAVENLKAVKLDKAVYDKEKANFATKQELATKQNALVSGENIKTINGESVMGKGDIRIREGVARYQIKGFNLKYFLIEGDRVYWGGFAEGLHCGSITENKELWVNSHTFTQGVWGKFIAILGDFVYAISTQERSLIKINKKTGELIKSRVDPDTISYGEILQSQANVIFSLGGDLYYWSYLTKTIYLVNTSDLSISEVDLYKGFVEFVDTATDWGCLVTTDKHYVWFDNALSETNKVDVTLSSVVVSPWLIWCIDSVYNSGRSVWVLAHSHGGSTCVCLVNKNGVNYTDTFVWLIREDYFRGLFSDTVAFFTSNRIIAAQSNYLLYPEKEQYSGVTPITYLYSQHKDDVTWVAAKTSDGVEIYKL